MRLKKYPTDNKTMYQPLKKSWSARCAIRYFKKKSTSPIGRDLQTQVQLSLFMLGCGPCIFVFLTFIILFIQI
jgi:hypothetical protein